MRNCLCVATMHVLATEFANRHSCARVRKVNHPQEVAIDTTYSISNSI